MTAAENQIPMADTNHSIVAADKTGSAQAKQSLRTWLKLLKSTKHVEAVIREKLRQEFDTTLPRFDVMAALYRFETGLKMTELSTALRVSNGNVTGIVERLVSDGAVLRVPVIGDKRAMLVRLTQKGREEFATQAAAHALWINEIFSALSPVQSSELLTVIDTIEDALAVQNEQDHLS